jgi:hypothetical protein
MISTLENHEFDSDAIVSVDDMLEQKTLLWGVLTKILPRDKMKFTLLLAGSTVTWW